MINLAPHAALLKTTIHRTHNSETVLEIPRDGVFFVALQVFFVLFALASLAYFMQRRAGDED